MSEITISERMAAAHNDLIAARSNLQSQMQDRVGMIRKYIGDDPTMSVIVALETHAKAAARLEMLTILSTTDFYDAMCMSAGATR